MCGGVGGGGVKDFALNFVLNNKDQWLDVQQQREGIKPASSDLTVTRVYVCVCVCRALCVSVCV